MSLLPRPVPARLSTFAGSLAYRPPPPNLRPCVVCGVPLHRHARCAGGCELLIGPGHTPSDGAGCCQWCARERASTTGSIPGGKRPW
jgi:hypothetical protein